MDQCVKYHTIFLRRQGTESGWWLGISYGWFARLKGLAGAPKIGQAIFGLDDDQFYPKRTLEGEDHSQYDKAERSRCL